MLLVSRTIFISCLLSSVIMNSALVLKQMCPGRIRNDMVHSLQSHSHNLLQALTFLAWMAVVVGSRWLIAVQLIFPFIHLLPSFLH